MTGYLNPREREQARHLKKVREDNIKLAVAALVFVIAIVASGIYGVWWWQNCATKPYFEAPMLCHMNNGSSSKK